MKNGGFDAETLIGDIEQFKSWHVKLEKNRNRPAQIDTCKTLETLVSLYETKWSVALTTLVPRSSDLAFCWLISQYVIYLVVIKTLSSSIFVLF